MKKMFFACGAGNLFTPPPHRAAGEENLLYYLRGPRGSSTYHILPPRASPAGNRFSGIIHAVHESTSVLIGKNHSSSLMHHKNKCDFRSRFSREKIRSVLCMISC